jgi:hypothetical protein
MYVAGSEGATSDVAQWRIEKRTLSDGGLVSSFGSGGSVTSNPSADGDRPHAIAADSGFIYVAGYDANAPSPDRYQWRIEKRSLSNGALDSTFGNAGAVTTNPSSAVVWANAIAIQSGYMCLAGKNQTGWRIEKRRLSDGLPWTNFGSGGAVTKTDGEALAIAFDIASNSMYVAGSEDFANWRIENRSQATGALMYAVVETFPSVGCGLQGVFAIAVDASSMYLAGEASGQWRVERRSLSDGALIYSQTLPYTGYCDAAKGIVIDGSAMYIAGIFNYSGRIEKRNLSDGALVSSFGGSGFVTPGYSYLGPNPAAIDTSFVYVAGTDLITGGDFRWRIEKRSLSSGSLCD